MTGAVQSPWVALPGPYRWRAAGLTLFALALAVQWQCAWAQSARSGGGAAAQALQQLQQLASERSALQAENAQLKKDLDDARKERDALKRAQRSVDDKVRSGEAALARRSAEKDAADREADQLKGKMQELVAKFRETAQTLRDLETGRAAQKQNLAEREQALHVCLDHNAALYKLNGEVLDRYEHQSVWSRLATREPFTQIKRAQLQNLTDDYRSRAQEQRIEPGVPAAQPAAEPAAPTRPAKP